jgi:hypothetical protein
MSETHTPGPWRAIKNRNRGFQIGGKCDRPAHFAKVADVRVSEHTIADAQLIAAAPELLAACEALMEPMRRYREHGTWTVGDEKLLFAAHDAARAAISKAKGPTHA